MAIILEKANKNIYDDYIQLLKEFSIINGRTKHLADEIKVILIACESENDRERKIREMTVSDVRPKQFVAKHLTFQYTKDQWCRIVEHFIRQEYKDLKDAEVKKATNDIAKEFTRRAPTTMVGFKSHLAIYMSR